MSSRRAALRNRTSCRGGSIVNISVQDKIFLASEIEIFGSTKNSAGNEGTQYQYYKNATVNRYKMPKWFSDSNSDIYWERSPNRYNDFYFCNVLNNGNQDTTSANEAYGIAPCLCV